MLGFDQSIVQTLVIPFSVEMDQVLFDGASKRSLAKQDHPVQALRFDRSHTTLTKCIQIRGAVWQADRLGSSILQQTPESAAEFAVAIHDQESLVPEKAVHRVRDVPSDLHHPGSVWVRRNSRDMDSSRREFHDEQDVEGNESTESPYLDGEEVGGRKAFPVRLEERAPRGSFSPLWRGIDAVLLRDAGDGRAGHNELRSSFGQNGFRNQQSRLDLAVRCRHRIECSEGSLKHGRR